MKFYCSKSEHPKEDLQTNKANKPPQKDWVSEFKLGSISPLCDRLYGQKAQQYWNIIPQYMSM